MNYRSITLLLLVTLLCGCQSKPKEDPKFKPVLNPTPKYFITYKGFIDPSLNHLVKLTILTIYTSTNPKCRKEINKLEGVSAPRERLHYSYVKPGPSGHFSYKVPLDKFTLGFCKWRIGWANYNDEGKNPNSWGNINTLATFTKELNKGKTLTKQKLEEVCTLKKCTVISTSINVGDDKNLLLSSNHIIQFDYYFKGKRT